MPITNPPTFNPAKFNIPLGVAGTVLTSNGATVAPTFQASGGGGGGFLPGFLSINVAAGQTDNLNPGGGWPANIARLDIDPNAGASSISGLLAGTDGQLVYLFNPDVANNLTLLNQSAASLAANRFQGSDDFILVPENGIFVCYYAGAVNRWRFIP